MSKPNISVLILRHIANCMRLTGSDPAILLAQNGLRREDLDDAKRTIPLQLFLSFLEEAAQQSGNPHFGLHAGQLASSDSLGPLGFLFLSAPTFRSAFRSFTAYLATMQQAAHNSFHEEEGLATFEYAITDQTLINRMQDAEFSISVMQNFCCNYIGSDFELTEVRFEHSCRTDIRPYREFFRCEVYFDQDTNSFSFEDRFLERQGGVIDSALFPIIEEHLHRQAVEHSGEVQTHKEALKLLEASPLDNTPSLDQAADKLGISVATLNRRLKENGMSWRRLVQERRMNAAGRLLKQSSRNVADIALAVGFSESASFVRSFNRHFGTTPKQYRDN